MTEQGKRWGGGWWRLALPMAGVMLVMATTACGGSGGGGGDAAKPPVATANQGRFIDAPVQGLSYRTRSTSGITDASGRFDYVTTGEDITFSIGGLVIGRAAANSDVHVYELETTAQEAGAGRNARVAQLLQSLDTNRGSGQSIVIDPAVAARIPATAALDWVSSQDGFDTSLRGLLGTLGLGSQFVSNATARQRADAFVAGALVSCPLELPAPPPQPPATPDAYKIRTGALTCLDRARVNHYLSRVQPLLSDQIAAGLNQAALAESSFNQEAFDAAMDVNPMLAVLDSVDALADFDTAAKKRVAVEAAALLAKALTDYAKAAVELMVSFTPVAAGQDDPANNPQVWFDLTGEVLTTVSKTAACVDYWNGESGTQASSCTAAIGQAITSFATVQGLPSLRLNGAADQQVLKAGLDTLSGVFRSTAAAQDLIAASGKSRGVLGKAAFGLAAALVQTGRDGVSLAYAVNGQPSPTAGWRALALGAVDRAALPVLQLGSRCYGGVAGADVATCATSIARESGKAVTALTVASIGTWEVVRNSGRINEAAVAQSVIEEILWAGEAGQAALIQKYFPGETNRTITGSLRPLAERVARLKHEMVPVDSYLSIGRVLWGAVVTSQSAVNVVKTEALVKVYLDMIRANTEPNFSSPSISITAQSDTSGRVQARVVVSPRTSGVAGGRLRCFADGASNHPRTTPWRADVNGMTPVDLTLTFDRPLRTVLVCALYTTGGVPRFVASQAVAVESVIPAAAVVTSLDVSPSSPRVGDAITLTAQGRNLGTSGFKFSNFPPCQTAGAAAPQSLTSTSMTYRCTAVRAMRLSYVGVIDAAGAAVPGIGQPLTVCPANATPGPYGACDAQPESGALYDDFTAAAIDAALWNIVGQPTIGGGFTQYPALSRINTQGKVTIAGSRIVIEARLAGQGGSRDTSIQLVDTQSGDYIYSGDTSYFGWGFFASGSGSYNFVEVERASGVGPPPQNVTTLGGTTNQFLEYRWTLEGDKITLERGPTLSNITQRTTRTLGRSIVGRSFYLSIGTASSSYSPGTWDWVRAVGSSSGATTGRFVIASNTLPGAVFSVPAGVTNCRFDATGTWSAGPQSDPATRNADGVIGGNTLNLINNGVPIPTAPIQALVAKRSTTNRFEMVGGSRTLAVIGGEQLSFMMNDATDNGYTNGNTGQLDVAWSCR